MIVGRFLLTSGGTIKAENNRGGLKMDSLDREFLEIIRQRPDLLGLAMRLVAEATERSASRPPAERDMPPKA